MRAESVWERPFCSLTHFAREAAADHPRVLVVTPLSGHFATLLRDTVDALLPEHDVYITEWANARDVPRDHGRFDLDDYVDDVRAMLRHLGPDTHVLAVCQPVVPVLAAVLLMAADDDPAQPRSMTLMAGPVDTRVSPTAVNEFAVRRPLSWFERYVVTTVPARYPGRGRRVYPGFAQLGAFMGMNPDRHLEAHIRLAHDLVDGDLGGVDRHRRFYDEYLAVMDMTAEYYLQTVDVVFQRFALPRGEYLSRGRLVESAAIRRTALMTIEGARDDITGLGQTRAAHDLCSGGPGGVARAPRAARGGPLRGVLRSPLVRGGAPALPRVRAAARRAVAAGGRVPAPLARRGRLYAVAEPPASEFRLFPAGHYVAIFAQPDGSGRSVWIGADGRIVRIAAGCGTQPASFTRVGDPPMKFALRPVVPEPLDPPSP